MEVRMERRFSMDDLLEAGRVRESAQAQMRRLGWLQPHSARRGREGAGAMSDRELRASGRRGVGSGERGVGSRSEEHTSELQSRGHLVCRLLLEKKKKHSTTILHMRGHTNLAY